MTQYNQLSQLPVDTSYIKHEDQYIENWFSTYPLYADIVNKRKTPFIFIDGPPFVSGKLHIGHVAVNVFKSAVMNYKAMTGHNTKYKLGGDCHGLPIESVVEKQYNLQSIDQKQQLGIKCFNKLCNDLVTEYADSWTPIYKNIGRLADFSDTYMTRDLNFMETCIWIFKQLWDKGLVYKAHKVMWYSWGCHTPLSNFEVSSNYVEVETKSIYVAFKMQNVNTYAVAWTTTPWTLTANMALCVGANIDYVELCFDNISNAHYILGKDAVERVFGKKKYSVISSFKGSSLVGKEYEPIYNYILQIDPDRKFKFIADSYVKTRESADTTNIDIGTSIVHIAPAFGADDFRVCVDNNIVDSTNVFKFCLVNAEAKFDCRVPEFNNRNAFDIDDDIRKDLKLRGHLIKTIPFKHNYPYCYRTNTPLINIPTTSFFIRSTKLKDRMIELNKQINWIPAEIGYGRFHNWIESTNSDWAVSRNRSYGTPICVWVADDDSMLCVGSIKELEELSGVTNITNLHPEYINDIVIEKDGKTYRRVPYILDCWFESGAVPFAQIHYPFTEESREIETRDFLCSLIIEGKDQTRGWFYTLLVLSTAILDKPAFQNVVCIGMVLDQDGRKISKKLGNYTDPSDLITKYGRDNMRLYFLSGQLGHAEPLKFNDSHIEKIRQRMIAYVNGVHFWIEHALNYQINYNIVLDINLRSPHDNNLTNILDKWFLTKISTLSLKIKMLMENYDLGKTVNILFDFIDDLTNWYIKFNRDRIKGVFGQRDWLTSLEVLYTGLMQYCILWAPFTPFLSEHIFAHIKHASSTFAKQYSVLLCDYPIDPVNTLLYESTNIVDSLWLICKIVRNLRAQTPTHNKQIVPLKKCTIYHANPTILQNFIHVIQKELNCLAVDFNTIDDNISHKIIVDRKAIGCKFKTKAFAVTKYLESLSEDEIKNSHVFCFENNTLDETYFKIVKYPKSTITTGNIVSTIDKDFMVSIDTTIDDEITYLTDLRKLYSTVQEMRKEMGVRPWNKIVIVVDNSYAFPKLIHDLTNIATNATIVVDNFPNQNIIHKQIIFGKTAGFIGVRCD